MKRRLLLIIVALVCLALPGCQTIGQAQHCAGWGPIYRHEGDRLTQPTADEILKHNRYGVASGCWKRPDGKGADR